jgi:hypothetical protein
MGFENWTGGVGATAAAISAMDWAALAGAGSPGA